MRKLVAGLGVERLWTRLGAFMGDEGVDVEEGVGGSMSALSPGMLDNTTHLTVVDPIQDWVKWDWKALLASSKRKRGPEGLKWISLCAAKSHVRMKEDLMWRYVEPPSADEELFVDGGVLESGRGNEDPSKRMNEDEDGNGRVCICCVKINKDDWHAIHTPYKSFHILRKKAHYSKVELWLRMLGLNMSGLEKCDEDKGQIRMDIESRFRWEGYYVGVLYARLLEC